MDFNLAALKLLCVQLRSARQTTTPSQKAFTLAGILFQRAWLQGILISAPSSSDGGGRLFLDDGTGVVELYLSAEFLSRDWESGKYVMVVGAYTVREGSLPIIQVHKMVDLSSFPHREPMWYLEVMEAFKLFYQSSFE